MSNIILPGPKSVLTPEKQYEAYHSTAEKTRDMLFMGAVMGMAEFIHQAGTPGKYRSESNDEFYDPRPTDAEDCTNRIMELLDYAYEKKWNVALEMINWKKNYIANRVKEKISGERTEGVQANTSAALSEAISDSSSG